MHSVHLNKFRETHKETVEGGVAVRKPVNIAFHSAGGGGGASASGGGGEGSAGGVGGEGGGGWAWTAARKTLLFMAGALLERGR